MHRIFLAGDNVIDGKIIITDNAQVHHIRDVVRLEPGEKLVAVNEKGIEHLCTVVSLKPQVCLKVARSAAGTGNMKIRVHIACALPKNSSFDDIVDKLTQLGVDEITPVESRRVIVKLDDKKKEQRYVRWLKIATSASQQCQRNRLPVINKVKKFTEVVCDPTAYGLKLIPTLPAKKLSLSGALKKHSPEHVIILIGPEGDFSDEEISLATRNGFLPVSLGALVLRVETAAVAVASYLMLNENL